jgi:hypothetical protein
MLACTNIRQGKINCSSERKSVTKLHYIPGLKKIGNVYKYMHPSTRLPDAPAKLISSLLQKLSDFGIEDPELSIDEIGRTPLHFAVGYSCNPKVVKVLVSSPAGKTSTRAQDCFGRLPLHAAMVPYDLVDKGSYCKIAPTSNIKPSEFLGILRKSIAILVAVCPGSVNVEDDKGMTPLEHAKPLEFDRKFQEWVQKVVKVGGAVFSEEEIAKQKAKVIDEVVERLKSVRMNEPIQLLRSKKKTSTVLTRQEPKPSLTNVAGYGRDSTWSFAASPY